ncbi:uncharacterized protein LOC120415946 [Culex pipiens pallens]|uniref:uncharacterized protein LOC120415946 n=2 Tax=Culex pipiens pallens TaxID=42434 RepID=UPI001954A41C|nr:uncharacterized protein LOC120415946 [Culex pipiens pallens]
MISNYVNYQHQQHPKENNWIQQDIMRSKHFLRENDQLYVTRADKGNKVVVIGAEEYRRKMRELVNDTTTYRQLEGDPTHTILSDLNTLVKQWWTDKQISGPKKRELLLFHCNPPRIYGLPKIHKPNRPLRPVVSTIGTATYKMAKFLAGILGHLVGKTNSHVRSSFTFAEEISKVEVPDGCVMYSLDVVSLYTNIPVDKIYRCIKARYGELARYTSIPWPSFKKALKIVLENAFFQYEGKIYGQTFGVPMGSPLSSVVSDIVMEKLERKNINKLQQKNITLHVYKRYVDDCFVVGREEDITTVVDTFNSTYESLQFTLEREKDASIRFLDLTLTRAGRKIEKKWYPKQENGRYLDYLSESPRCHKRNTAIALVDRALMLTDPDKRPESIRIVKNILLTNNYPAWFISRTLKERVHFLYNSLEQERKRDERASSYASVAYIPHLSEKVGKALRKHGVVAAYKPNNKIKNTVFSKLKDKIPMMQQTNVVYSVPCGACADKVYIGQTSQKLEKRLKQHKDAVRTNNPSSGLAQHSLELGHVFDFSRASILEKVETERLRCTAEMLHIKMRGSGAVNLQRESASLSSSYNCLLKKIRETERATRSAVADQATQQEE